MVADSGRSLVVSRVGQGSCEQVSLHVTQCFAVVELQPLSGPFHPPPRLTKAEPGDG